MTNAMTLHDAVVAEIERQIQVLESEKIPWYRFGLRRRHQEMLADHRRHLKTTLLSPIGEDTPFDGATKEHRDTVRLLSWPYLSDS